jgi:UDP-GlcNAc:undecaprenyl-phosphate GlcNAc-1-phosphate transferase
MSFPLNLYLLSFGGGCVATFVTLPLWRAWCRSVGLLDEPDHRKTHETPVPLAGGLAILTGLLLPVGIAWLGRHLEWLDALGAGRLTYGFERRSIQLIAVLSGAVGMTLFGALDDAFEFRASVKFAGQIAIALLVAAAGIRITLFVPSLVFSYAITVLWVVTVTNAFNFTDNMNGLCAGLATIASLLLFGVSAVLGHYLVASLALLVSGATLGFLPYNFPRASVFLGDAGSHLLGFLLAVLTILPHFYSPKHPHRWAVIGPLLILGVPLVDLLWVVCVRLRNRKPVYVADNNHFSHRLVQRGWSKPNAVLLLWTVALGVGLLVFLL